MTAKTMTGIGVITTTQNTSLTFAHYNRFFVLPHLDHDNYFMINRTLNVYVKKIEIFNAILLSSLQVPSKAYLKRRL